MIWRGLLACVTLKAVHHCHPWRTKFKFVSLVLQVAWSSQSFWMCVCVCLISFCNPVEQTTCALCDAFCLLCESASSWGGTSYWTDPIMKGRHLWGSIFQRSRLHCHQASVGLTSTYDRESCDQETITACRAAWVAVGTCSTCSLRKGGKV